MKSGNTFSGNKFSPFNIVFGTSSLIAVTYFMRGMYQLIQGVNLPVDLAHRWWRYRYLILENKDIYESGIGAVYPPSSYILMGPFLGWTPYNYTVEFWAVVNVVSLIAISYFVYQFILMAGKSRRWALLSIPLIMSFHSISMVLGVGQITILYVACMMSTLYLGLYRPMGDLWSIIVGSFTLAIAMGKFSLIIPICLVMLMDNRFRSMLFAAVGINVILSWSIAYRLGSSLLDLIINLFENTQQVIGFGSIDLHNLIDIMGLDPKLSGLASIILLILFGVYLMLSYQPNSIFKSLALAAIVTRFWTYHAHYDNLILIFVLIYTMRSIALQIIDNWSKLGRIEILWMLGVWFSLVIPARFLTIEAPYWGVFLGFQVFIWFGSGILLLSGKKNDRPRTLSSFYK